MNTGVLFSHNKDDWRTPPKLFAALHDEFRFTIDGAANADNHLLRRWMGPGSKIGDALDADWSGHRVWLNPPYSMISEFAEKAAVEFYANNVTTVMLIPSRTDTRWWHEHIWDRSTNHWHAGVSARFLRGRVKFEHDGAVNNSAPFPSVIVIFGEEL